MLSFGQVAQQFNEAVRSERLVVGQRLFADLGETDIHFPLVAGVDLARDERLRAVLERADDARHLGRQDAEQTLNVSDDHCAVLLQDGQGEKFHFLQIPGAPAASQRGQTEVCNHLE